MLILRLKLSLHSISNCQQEIIMNVAPILIMASAVLVFAVSALGIATLLGVAIGQTRIYLEKKTQA